MSDLSSYTERLTQKGPATWLGVLVYYSVIDAVRVEHAIFEQAVINSGLNATVPPAPKDDDIFRRVCSNAQRKRVPTAVAGVFENILVRDPAPRSGGKVWKQVVIEQVDANNKRLSYDAIVQLEFDSSSGTITCTTLEPSREADAERICQEINDEYQLWRGCLHGYTVREFIRRVILSTNATSCRDGGGLYFVQTARLDVIEALERVINGLDGASVHTIPLVDDENQRAMLRDAVSAETSGEIDKAIDEIDAILKGNPITQKRATDIAGRMHGLVTKTEEYADLLDDELSGTKLRLNSYKQHVKKLLMEGVMIDA